MELTLDIETTTPRMTKRTKMFKPKQQLTKPEVQTLVALLKNELQGLEESIGHYAYVALQLKPCDKEQSDLYFKRADKARETRNRLAKIQHVLKRGL